MYRKILQLVKHQAYLLKLNILYFFCISKLRPSTSSTWGLSFNVIQHPTRTHPPTPTRESLFGSLYEPTSNQTPQIGLMGIQQRVRSQHIAACYSWLAMLCLSLAQLSLSMFPTISTYQSKRNFHGGGCWSQ